MTREEAIAIIRQEYLCVDRNCDIERSCGKCDLAMPSKEPILEAYKMAIKALEQEPKTGHWIRVDKTKVKCSECDITHFIAQYPMGQIKFCPNCGTKMAIEALEQKPCEDAISRAETIAEIKKYRLTSGVTNQGTWNACVSVISDAVKNKDWFPSVQPTLINASDIKSDDEWMQDNEWDEIYAKENLPDINVGNIKESEDKE